jgi:hypothetical protein
MTTLQKIQWNSVTWYSKTLALVLFVVLICGAFYFGIWYQKQVTVPIPQPVSSKEAYVPAVFGGEVPSGWSIFHGPDSLPAKNLESLASANQLSASFARGPVSFGDGAFEQVDFYVLSSTAKQALIDQTKKNGDQISQETVGGAPAIVITYPTDNGQIDKNGSGGKDYLIGNGKSPTGFDEYLLMRDWSLGDQEFESGLQHFLQRADFTSGW